ncbi:MAG: phage tail protein [Acidimicrobiales bacterium]|jgi:phage tail-like protein
MTTTTGIGGHFVSRSNFLFEVDGESIGLFGEVSGLEVNVDSVTYAEGGENGYVHKLPGRLTWPNIVLRRGITNSDALFAWVNKTAGPKFESNHDKLERATAAITLIADDGKRLRSWEMQGAFAVRWSGPTLSAGNDGAATEELEIAHHGFTSKTF